VYGRGFEGFAICGYFNDPSDVSIWIKQVRPPFMSEIIFEVHEDEVDGGYTASALGYGIHTQGETLE
jgi:hypothetical protein